MTFNKDKIKAALNSVNDVCVGCRSYHSSECQVSIACEALRSVE